MRRWILAALLVFWAAMAQAATTRYVNATSYDGVTTFSSLSLALTTAPALTHGDTVIFTDSATYTEAATVTFSASVSVYARTGCNPTITNGANNVATMFLFNYPTAGGNMQFGSLLGADNGRINILYQKQATPTVNTSLFKMTQYQYKRVTFQNLSIYETGTGYAVNVFTAAGGSGYRHVYVTLSYVDIDINANGSLLNVNTNFALGVTAGSDSGSGSGISQQCIWTLDHVRIKNFGMCAMGTTAQGSTFNLSYCDFGNLNQSVTGGYPMATVYNRMANCNWKGYFDHCVFRAPAGNANFMVGGVSCTSPAWGTSVTLNRCVLVSKPTSSGAYGNLYLYAQTTPAATGGYTARVALDHCDLVDLGTGFDSATYAAIYRPTGTSLNIKHNLVLTNNNIYSARNRAINIVDATNCTVDAGSHNNNVIGNVGGYATAKPNVNYAGATGDVSLDPGYINAICGDMRYTNTTLKTADEFGGPIGVNASYTDPVASIDTNLGLFYKAGTGALVDGVSSKTLSVAPGGTGSEVVASALAHYHFTGWSDGVSSLARTDGPMTNNLSVMANCDLDTYTLNYAAGANGEVTGTLSQVVGWNLNGTAVTAVPDTGYHFTQWEDALTSNPRTDYNVTADAAHTASFAVNSYTYNYVAGVGGTVNGAANVTGSADYNTNGPSVTAAPEAGYRFVKWLDNDSVNPTRQDIVTADFTTTATFEALVQHSVTYTAGSGGTITGSLSQTVSDGGNGTEVVAVANTGYHFVNWSDGNTNAARTETNVTADIGVTANFAINTYSVSYTAGANGTISGSASQTVNYGGSGTEVVATPNTGYHFVNWSDGVLTAARTDSNVTGAISVTATFAADSCTLTYTAGSNGTITGSLSQTVNYGGSGTQVVAVPNAGYHFVDWSDANTNAARTDTNVTGNISVTANFAADFNPGTTVKVPTDYGTIQAAINAANEGGTVEIVNSATYKENLRINKSVNLVATAGQSPKVEQADNSTTAPVILGVTASASNVRLGSLSGGRITFQYLKWGIATGGTLPYGMIRVESTTGSTVLVENCDIISTGPTTYGMCSGIQHGQNPCSVTIRYTNINLNRADYTAGGVSTNRAYAHGIDISNNNPTGGATISRRIPGPAYTLDHVRIKNYVRSGLWLHYTSMTLTASYIDVGTAGENFNAGTNMPWGPLVSFTATSTWTGRIDHSIFGGPLNYSAFGKVGPLGTSITLSRTVILGTGGANAVYGGLDCGSNAVPTVAGNPVRLSIDHCDLVHLGAAPAAALVRNVANGTINLAITNSNIYSASGQAINLTQIASPNVFSSSNNNVFGAAAAVGYTAGTGDLAVDPLYFDAANGDVRYYNNTLKTAGSDLKPIGVNADYGDIFNIVPGFEGILNRAHGWTTLK